MTQGKQTLIFVFIFINILIIVDAGFMMPLWSDFVTKIGGDIRTAGNAILIFSVVIGFLTCLAGAIETRVNRDSFFMIVSQIIMCIGYLGYFFVKQPIDLYVVQIILGIGGAFQSPVLCSLYQRAIPKNKTSHYWGIWNGMYQVAMGIGALLSAYIVHHLGYNTMFSVMLAVSLMCLCYVVWVMRVVHE